MKDRMYCLTCKRMFKDMMDTRRRQNVITFNQFFQNQLCIIKGIPIRHTKWQEGTATPVRIFDVRCPHCESNKVVNATEIIEYRTRGGDRRTQKFKLYNEIKLAFEQEHLSTMKNILNYGDEKNER